MTSNCKDCSIYNDCPYSELDKSECCYKTMDDIENGKYDKKKEVRKK